MLSPCENALVVANRMNQLKYKIDWSDVTIVDQQDEKMIYATGILSDKTNDALSLTVATVIPVNLIVKDDPEILNQYFTELAKVAKEVTNNEKVETIDTRVVH
jgi:hypothetical protein